MNENANKIIELAESRGWTDETLLQILLESATIEMLTIVTRVAVEETLIEREVY